MILNILLNNSRDRDFNQYSKPNWQVLTKMYVSLLTSLKQFYEKRRTLHQEKTLSLSPFTQTPHPPLRKESLISSINHGSKVASQFNGKLQ